LVVHESFIILDHWCCFGQILLFVHFMIFWRFIFRMTSLGLKLHEIVCKNFYATIFVLEIVNCNFFHYESQSKLDQPIFWSILCVMLGLKMITKRLWSQLLLIFTKFSGNHQKRDNTSNFKGIEVPHL